MSLIALLSSLTVAQAWALAVAAVGVIVGSATLGAWVQSARGQGKLNEKEITIFDLKREKGEVETQRDAAKRSLEWAVDAVKAAARERQALAGKSEFLERWITYINAPNDVSRKLFVDHVCALWKNSQDYNIAVDRAGLQLTDVQIQQGLSSELRALLIQSGLKESDLQLARGQSPMVGPFVFEKPKPNQGSAKVHKQARAMVHKYGTGILVVKTIKFYDGTVYQVPQEIATIVHMRPDCGPH